MKCFIVFALFAAVVALTVAFPAEQVQEEQQQGVDDAEGEHVIYQVESIDEVSGVRQKRATCDLLSFSTKFGSLNHSACAAHCLVMNRGFRGGSCKDGVCHCRR